jgi:transcriptional antiterminator NusG
MAGSQNRKEKDEQVLDHKNLEVEEQEERSPSDENLDTESLDRDSYAKKEDLNSKTSFAQPEAPMQWFVLRVQSGREDKVKASLESRIEAMQLHHKMDKVLVPTEKITEIRKDFKRVIDRKIYPGYVMVHMISDKENQSIPDKDAQYVAKSISGVGDFAGTLSREEADRMIETCGHSQDKPKPKVSFLKGQTIKIKEGAFENYEGIVDEVNEARAIIKVRIGIFGRFTQVELGYWQVENV